MVFFFPSSLKIRPQLLYLYSQLMQQQGLVVTPPEVQPCVLVSASDNMSKLNADFIKYDLVLIYCVEMSFLLLLFFCLIS